MLTLPFACGSPNEGMIPVVGQAMWGTQCPLGFDGPASAAALEAQDCPLEMELLDHLIIGRGRWTSLRALGALAQPPATMR